MNELKFRFYMSNFKNPRYFYWEDITKLGDEYVGSYLTTKNEKVIIEQYTGLKDKNGKEIYVGDILKVTQFDDYGYISFTQRNCSFQIKGVRSHSLIHAKHYEVVGNIHENKELLNG